MSGQYPVYRFNKAHQIGMAVGGAFLCTFTSFIVGGSLNGGFGLFQGLFSAALTLFIAFIISVHLSLLFRNEFLEVVVGGIQLRDIGFVPWGDISKITLSNAGIFIQLRLPESTGVPRHFFRRTWRRGDETLLFLRTIKTGLNANMVEIVLNLQVQYAAFLAPSRNFSLSTPNGEIDQRIAEEKNGIKFFDRSEELLAAFKV